MTDELPDLDREELLRRLPEIRKIEDEKLREQVIDIFLHHCPDYFWWCPASSSGNHHPPDTRGRHGLWLHSRRAFSAFEDLARTEVEMEHIDEDEVDYGRAAILLHDLFKQGLPPRDEHHTQGDHDRVASRFSGRKTELPDEILGLIDSHNGAWNEGKTPENELELLHHRADYIVSRRDCHYEISDPCEELQQVIRGRKTEEEHDILSRVSALSTAAEGSNFVDNYTLPGQGDVDPGGLSKVVDYIANGGEKSQ
ncbi:HD domain-containing protein [Natrinema sp. H-ect4]|uniref:HD domain-containing protein n=1 Tax=Natrinema sp. H-ect4 TaxID=3242699 RepID=UPI0035A81D0A